jgi:tetratricopeptide (TPR) repeat protein
MEVMAAIARDAGNLTAAAVAYEAILELVPEESRALQGLAQLSVQQGDYERAIEQYNRARRERPRDASLLNNLAVSHRAVGHADTARTLWREALSLQDDHADAHYNLGTALYLDGESAQALPHLRRAVELAPDSAKYHSNAAAAHQAVGLPLQAVAFWQSAIRVDPSYVDAYFNMAFTFQYDLGDPESALRHWEMARELTPADADVIMHGAQALLDLGHMDAAASWLRTFLDRNPHHLRNRELEAALEKIRVAPG